MSGSISCPVPGADSSHCRRRRPAAPPASRPPCRGCHRYRRAARRRSRRCRSWRACSRAFDGRGRVGAGLREVDPPHPVVGPFTGKVVERRRPDAVHVGVTTLRLPREFRDGRRCCRCGACRNVPLSRTDWLGGKRAALGGPAFVGRASEQCGHVGPVRPRRPARAGSAARGAGKIERRGRTFPRRCRRTSRRSWSGSAVRARTGAGSNHHSPPGPCPGRGTGADRGRSSWSDRHRNGSARRG